MKCLLSMNPYSIPSSPTLLEKSPDSPVFKQQAKKDFSKQKMHSKNKILSKAHLVC